ncbi:MAG: protein kinase [Oscillochloris sp.]|nr:protein kinase [Oscillochloris sp.]
MLEPETLIHDRYRIIGLVGQGAMGAVYEAIDQRIGQSVALKQTLTLDPSAMDALEREALILAGLRHPALPVVSDTFADTLGQFLAMSFVPGPNLADLLEQQEQAFASATVLAWADQILDALIYLHGQNPPVLHRDIKPQNLKLTSENTVVLLDFGLARGAVFQTRIAGQRSMVGYTLPYAPLEQIRGTDTDPRSDLFALASTLYHLITGSPPPDSLERAAARIAGQPDPLISMRIRYPELPISAVTALDRCLQLDPDARINSAEELRRQLHLTQPELVTSRKASIAKPERVWSRYAIPVGLVLVALVLLGRLMFMWSISDQAAQMITFAPTSTFVPITKPTSNYAEAYPLNTYIDNKSYPYPEFTPPRTYPAPFRHGQYDSDLVPSESRMATPAPVQTALAATASAAGLRQEITCANNENNNNYFVVSPDGEFIALNCTSKLHIFQTSDKKVFSRFEYDAKIYAFTPDSAMLAVSLYGDEIQFWRLDTMQLDRVLSLVINNAIQHIAFSPDGTIIIITDVDGKIRFVDSSNGKVISSSRAMATIYGNAFSTSERYFAASDINGKTYIWEYKNGQYRQITSYSAQIQGPVSSLSFSSDQQTLFIGMDETVLRYDFKGNGSALPFGEEDWHNPHIAASPIDNTLIIGDNTGKLAVYQEGTNKPSRILRENGPPIYSLTYTSDGHTLMVQTEQGIEIWDLNHQSAR